jgi:TolB-like protein
MDTELPALTEKLASQIKDHGKKKVAVLDFTDLQGGTTELGKYIAEQLTVDFVMGKRDFSVLDRANLRKILAEHKLTALGLIDPDNAKKLGQFAGVDALIMGTMVQLGQTIDLTAKVITTDTAEVVGAAKSKFKADEVVQQLLSHPTAEGGAGGALITESTDDTKVVKSFGDLRVELSTLRVVNGDQFMLAMTLTNQNAKKSIWVALGNDNSVTGWYLNGSVIDSDGVEFRNAPNGISGIQHSAIAKYRYPDTNPFSGTEIKPNESLTATVKYVSSGPKQPAPGRCKLQLDILVGHDFSNNKGIGESHTLICDLMAN